MTNTKRLCAIAIISCCQQATASDFNISNFYLGSVYGSDDNPLRVSDVHSPQNEEFLFNNFRFSGNYKKSIYFATTAKQSNFFSDDRADQSNYDAKVGVKSDFNIKEQNFNYGISAQGLTSDATYVSRRTGQTATFRGEEVGDRYDADTFNINADISFQTHFNTTFSVEIQIRDKEYVNYNRLGLSNLDYTHDKFIFGAKYKLSNAHRFSAATSYTSRDFDDRRAKDITGDDVDGSNLIYNYNEIKLSYIYRPSQISRWKYSVKYTQRKDNNSGYWNADSGSVSVYNKYTLANNHTFTNRLKYSSFTYDNQFDPNLVSLEDEIKERKGFSYSLDYHFVFATLQHMNVGLYSSFDYYNFDSRDINYQYDRKRISLGIRLSFF